MRVLHFFKTARPTTYGGIEQVIHQLAEGCSNQGVQVDVLYVTRTRMEKTINYGNYRIHRVPQDFQIASTSFALACLKRFRQLSRKADVVHYHFPWPFMDLLHFMFRVDKPTVVTYHSDIVRQKSLLKLYRPLRDKFLASMDTVIATSPNYLQTSDVLRRLNDKVRVIPIGLDKSTYPMPTEERLKYWRDRLGKRFFLFVGAIRYYKGLHILIEAAQSTNYPIIIVGAGPVEKELKAQVMRLGVNNIFFLGQLSEEDKVALLTLCYAVVFPSHLRSEAFGISLLEGAMYGKPMISSEIGTGTTYINIADETGIVVPPGNPVMLRSAMDYLWNNPEAVQKMGKKAAERYREYFTADRMVEEHMILYGELLAKRKNS